MARDLQVLVNGELFLPSTVLAEMKAIDTGASLLVSAVANDAKVSQSLRTAVNQYWENWTEYYKENRGWLSRAVNTTFQKVKDFRAQFEELRAQYARESGKSFVPTISKQGITDSFSGAKQLLIAGALGALVFWLWRK
jgi:hypothetical protein